MRTAFVVKGHVDAKGMVVSDETVPLSEGPVEVTVTRTEATPGEVQDLIDFLKSLPPGTRSKEDIDKQIRDERDSWDRS